MSQLELFPHDDIVTKEDKLFLANGYRRCDHCRGRR